MEAAAVETEAGTLKLIGGLPCLDFVNTLAWRGTEEPQERLGSYKDLVRWGEHAGVLSGSEARELLKKSGDSPATAKEVFARAIVLREALHGVFSAVVGEGSPEASDLDLLNAELEFAMSRMRLRASGEGYELVFESDGAVLDGVLWPIVRSAVDLLTSEKLGRLRSCASEECGWLFLDTTRNRSRRWCDMKECGNREKARKFYRRSRATGT